jgi:hypothetical protein
MENGTDRDLPSGLALLVNPTATLVISKAKIIPPIEDSYFTRKTSIKQKFKLRSTPELRHG